MIIHPQICSCIRAAGRTKGMTESYKRLVLNEEKKDKKKKPTGRLKKRKQYNKRQNNTALFCKRDNMFDDFLGAF
jgi:hypothetical protein